MRNYDESVQLNHGPNWAYISNHPSRILIIGGSGSGKNNVLLHLIKQQQPNNEKSIKIEVLIAYQWNRESKD